MPTRLLDTVIDRLRALPEADQERVAAEIVSILDEPSSVLTPDQWSLVDAEISASADGSNLSHAIVVSRMRRDFGR